MDSDNNTTYYLLLEVRSLFRSLLEGIEGLSRPLSDCEMCEICEGPEGLSWPLSLSLSVCEICQLYEICEIFKTRHVRSLSLSLCITCAHTHTHTSSDWPSPKSSALACQRWAHFASLY
ncbi:hypothetical protein O6H91_18G047400 [Diphasiastrum complanatum]|uniref:Uncharacterized protein n=1 Tax=Diphasiastrum complanatum TaxID=34168 RepID=A0ACC2B0K4_DIPCM|nr:hypothetical protein O6H91_18G047400 [Diphasiastrum complanatum]